MRFLLINEHIVGRGAEQIASDQMEILKKNGHVVRCLCFSFSPDVSKLQDISTDYDIIHIPSFDKFLFDPIVYCKLRSYIKKFNPDKIIVHNIFSSPLTVYRAFRGFDTIQIVHDFKIICPTTFCIHLYRNYSLCLGYKYNNCQTCCSSRLSEKLFIFLRLKLVKSVEKLRKKYIKRLLCPSKKLTDNLRLYGYQSYTLNNPIRTDNIVLNNLAYCPPPKLIIAGGLIFEKGTLSFIRAIQNIGDCTIDVYGGKGNSFEYSEMSALHENSNGRFNYHGYIRHDNLMSILPSYSFIIVPSIGVDNYPTIILEAMLHKVCVVASNRGGASELLANGRGLLFDWNDAASLDMVIKKIYSISADEYQNFVDKAFNYVIQNNNISRYYDRIILYVNKD